MNTSKSLKLPVNTNDTNDITVRSGNVEDLPGIESLFLNALHREPNSRLIADALNDYPSTVASHSTGTIIGFAYCGYMSPDLLELMNITVHSDHRSTGVGTRTLNHIESSVFENYEAIMLTNSVAYKDDGTKRSASNFYLRNGYTLIASTGATNMFWKAKDK